MFRSCGGDRCVWVASVASVARISEAPSGNQVSEVRNQVSEKNHFTAKNAKKRIERKKTSVAWTSEAPSGNHTPARSAADFSHAKPRSREEEKPPFQRGCPPKAGGGLLKKMNRKERKEKTSLTRRRGDAVNNCVILRGAKRRRRIQRTPSPS